MSKKEPEERTETQAGKYGSCEEWIKAIVGASPIPQFIINRDHRILFWNEALEKYSGIKSKDVLGTDQHWKAFYRNKQPCLSDLLLDGKEDSIPELYGGRYNKSELINGAYEAVDFFPHIGESGIWLDFTASTIRDSRGVIIGAIETLKDVTEQKILEEEQNKTRLWQEGVNRVLESVLAPEPLESKLKIITDGVIEIFGVDLCRIWLIEEGDLCESTCIHAKATKGPGSCSSRDRCLHLKASSGHYSHLEEELYRRVPLGAYTIGRIANGENDFFLTNDAAHEPLVHDHKTVKETGLFSFAEYRMKPPGNEILGVFAVFSKSRISPEMDRALRGLSRSLALIIQKEIAEKKVIKSRDYYLKLFDEFPNPIWRSDTSGKCDYFNKEWLRFTGRTADQEMGDGWTEGVHPEDFDLCLKIYTGAFSKRQPFEMEYRLRYNDGTYHWLLDSGKPFYDLDGRFAGYIGACYDINGRKLAEEEEELTRGRFETLLKVSEMHDATEAELSEYVMQAASRMTNSSLAFIGTMTPDESVMDIIAWSESTMMECKAAASPIHYPIDSAGIWADAVRKRMPKIVNNYSEPLSGKKELPKGHVKITRFLSIPIFDDERIVMVAAVANKPQDYDETDVTRLTLLMQGVWVNLQRRRAEEALRENENRYRTLFEESPISLWEEDFSKVKDWIDTKKSEGITDFGTYLGEHQDECRKCARMVRVIQINRATTVLFGADSSEEFSRGVDMPFSAESLDSFCDEIVALSKGETEFEKEVILRTFQGEEKIVIMKVIVVPGYEQSLSRIFVSVIDITQRKNVEESLREANKKLNMLSSITRHDILNMIMVIRGYLELSEDLDDKTVMQGYLEKEIEAVNTIQRQIEFTRYYQDIGVKEPDWQDTEAVADSIAGTLDLKGIKFENSLKGLEIFCDPLIEKVFYNLIENSLRHGEYVTSIGFSYSEEEDGLVISYRDNGTGISEEEKKKLFKKGFGKHTGLGLFLSKEILSITGISIAEDGVPGKGVNFRITVPKGSYRFKWNSC